MHEAEGHVADGLPLAFFPVLGADVIAENDTTDGQARRDGEFEGVAFDLAGDGAEDGEAGLLVVAGVAEDDGGAASCLFASCLRIEHQPAQGSEFGHGRGLGLHGGRISLPTSAPHSVAG